MEEVPDLTLVAGVIGSIFLASLLFCFLFCLSLRSSAATKAAVKFAENNMEVIANLGMPLRTGFVVFGTIAITNVSIFRIRDISAGFASLSIPLKGSIGAGRLRAKLSYINGSWKPYFASIRIGNRDILLLKGDAGQTDIEQNWKFGKYIND